MAESPAYTIQLFTEKRSFSRGDEVQISIYMVGAGDVLECKLSGHIPKKLVSNNVTVWSYNFHQINAGWSASWPRNEVYVGNRFDMILSNHYFSKETSGRRLWSESNIRRTEESEAFSPIEIKFVISDSSPFGDHKIELILKYKSPNNTWSVSSGVITIHILSNIEKIAVWLPIITSVLLGLLLTFLRRFLQAVEITYSIWIQFSILAIIGISLSLLIWIFMYARRRIK